MVFTGKMLNSFNGHESSVLSNSYRRVLWYRSVLLGISCQSSSWEMLTVRWLYLALDYDMSLHGPQAWAGRRALHCCSPGSSQKPTPSASTGGCVSSLVSSALSCSLPVSLALASDRVVCIVSSHSKYLVSSPRVLLRWISSSRLWSAHLTGSVDLTYKPAAERESETHSRRVRLRCGLPPNAGKSLFWQDSHLLPREGQGLMVGCL